MTFEAPPIVKLAERLLVEIEQTVCRFTRYHKYTTGTQLRRRAWAALPLCAKISTYAKAFAWNDQAAGRTTRTDLYGLATDEAPLPKAGNSALRPIRRTGHQGLRTVALVPELPFRHGRASECRNARSTGQRWTLRTRQLPMG